MPRRNHRTKPTTRTPQPARCQGKRAYASQVAAERAIDMRDDDLALRCYLCTICGKWHLTSQSR